MKRVCVIGLGYIGLPTSILFAGAGCEVLGVDILTGRVSALSRGELHIAEPGLDEELRAALDSGRLRFSTEPEPSDVFIITVQTPHYVKEDGTHAADMRFVDSAARSIAAVLKPGALVVLESTVPPYTSRRLEELLSELSGVEEGSFYVAHCPERVIPGRIMHELRENHRIIGARDRKAAEMARELYEPTLKPGRIHVTGDLCAEMCKLVENTYRDINIAYANELSTVCRNVGIDVFELVELANLHPRVNVHNPGVGVGGHCIAVDPWFIHELYPEDTPLIGAARKVNDAKPGRVADAVGELVAPGGRICVLGLAYKPDIDDMRESPSVALCEILRERGYELTACEPNLVEEAEHKGIRLVTLDEALDSGAFLIVTLKHREFVDRAEELAIHPLYDCVGLIRTKTKPEL